MNDHDGTVFPHYADKKPKKNADYKCEDVPRYDVEPGQPIANQLDNRGDPFDDIDFFQTEFLLKRPLAQYELITEPR